MVRTLWQFDIESSERIGTNWWNIKRDSLDRQTSGPKGWTEHVRVESQASEVRPCELQGMHVQRRRNMRYFQIE